MKIFNTSYSLKTLSYGQNNQNNGNNIRINHNFKQKEDTVVFTSNSVKNRGNQDKNFIIQNEADLKYRTNVKTGMKVAEKIIQSPSKDLIKIEEILNTYTDVPVCVRNFEENPLQDILPSNVQAHTLPMYNHDFSLNSANIYIKNPDFANQEEMSAFIANLAHEYTHVLQRNDDKEYYGFKNIFDSVSECQEAARITQTIMNNAVIPEYSRILMSSKMFQNWIGSNKTKFSPLEIENLCSKNKNRLKNMTDKLILDCVNSYKQHSDSKISKEVLYKAVKMFIKQEALNEAEAYTVTLETLDRCGIPDRENYANKSITRGIYAAVYNSVEI